MNSVDHPPTFQSLRQEHGISLEEIYEYAEKDISLDEIRLFDETGRANPYTADDLLYILSQVSGQSYNRTNVEGIIFVLARPPVSPTNPQPQDGYLPEQPTLLDLYRAYNLDLNWIGEALKLNSCEVWEMIAGPISPKQQPVVHRFLQVVSQYTGVTYTLGDVQIKHAITFTSDYFAVRSTERQNDDIIEITPTVSERVEM